MNITGLGPHKSICNNCKGLFDTEVDKLKGSLWALPCWHSLHSSALFDKVKDKEWQILCKDWKDGCPSLLCSSWGVMILAEQAADPWGEETTVGDVGDVDDVKWKGYSPSLLCPWKNFPPRIEILQKELITFKGDTTVIVTGESMYWK